MASKTNTEPREDPCFPESAGGAATGYTIYTLCLEESSHFGPSAVCWTVLALFNFHMKLPRDSKSLPESSGVCFCLLVCFWLVDWCFVLF